MYQVTTLLNSLVIPSVVCACKLLRLSLYKQKCKCTFDCIYMQLIHILHIYIHIYILMGPHCWLIIEWQTKELTMNVFQRFFSYIALHRYCHFKHKIKEVLVYLCLTLDKCLSWSGFHFNLLCFLITNWITIFLPHWQLEGYVQQYQLTYVDKIWNACVVRSLNWQYFNRVLSVTQIKNLTWNVQ